MYLYSPDGFQCYWHDKVLPLEMFSMWHIMIWGAFSFSGTMELQVVQGSQMAVGYVEMLLQASLLTKGPCLWCDCWVFQQDNTAVHIACLTKDFLQENNIAYLDHPACSPDLNPTENMQGWMAREVYENRHQFITLDALYKSYLHYMEQHSHQPPGNTRNKND